MPTRAADGSYHRDVDEPAPTRSLTIDRPRHARIVRDLVVEAAQRRLRQWWLLPAAVVLLLPTLPSYWYVGVAILLAAIGIHLQVWRATAVRATRQGLDVGQTVTVAYTEDDQLAVTDVTGQVFLPRGSAMLVRRTRGNASVYGRSASFVLPGELLTDEDIAFLQGPGPSSAEAFGPTLPLSLDVTEQVQDALVAQATRSVVRSADFLLPYVCALAIIVLATATRLWPLLFVAAFFLLLAVPGLFGLGKTRRRFRRIHPVGSPMRGLVTPGHLTVSRRQGTVVHAWDRFTARKVTDKAVLLRIRRAPLTTTRTEVLPRALFPPGELALLKASVPKRF